MKSKVKFLAIVTKIIFFVAIILALLSLSIVDNGGYEPIIMIGGLVLSGLLIKLSFNLDVNIIPNLLDETMEYNSIFESLLMNEDEDDYENWLYENDLADTDENYDYFIENLV